MHVAVVRDRPPMSSRGGAARPLDAEGRTEEIAQAIAEELHDLGHRTIVCDGDGGLLPILRDFMPHQNGCPTGIVFNLVRRAAGEDQRTQIPAMLEMAGIPCTGPTPSGHAIGIDRFAVRALLRQARIATPDCCVARSAREVPPDLALPLIVRARDVEAPVGSRLARSPAELEEALDEVASTCGREALVDQFMDGETVTAALLGNGGEIEVLPLLDSDGENNLVSGGVRPPILPALANTIGEMACAAFSACRCQDYALVRFRVDQAGRPFVVGVDSMPALAAGGSLALAAAGAGLSRSGLVERVIDVAFTRYFGVAAPRFELTRDTAHAWRRAGPAER